MSANLIVGNFAVGSFFAGSFLVCLGRKSSQKMDFNSLLQQAQKLTNETQNSEEIPSVERTISQVLQATKDLHSRVTQTGTQDIQAWVGNINSIRITKFQFHRHILLGSKGIDLTKISQKLEALNTRKTFEPLDPIADTDVQNFLKNEKENAILSVIEEVHKNVSKLAVAKHSHSILLFRLLAT